MKIYGDKGELIFDGDSLRLFLEVERGSGTYTSISFLTLSKVVVGSDPMIFMRTSSTTVGLSIGSYSSSNKRLTMRKSPTVTVDWIAYATTIPNVLAGEEIGMRAWDKRGGCVFSDMNKSASFYLKRTSVADITVANWSSPPYVDVAHASLSDPYYFVSFPQFARKIESGNIRHASLFATRIDANTVRLQWQDHGISFGTFGPDSLLVCNPPVDLLMVAGDS